MVMMTGEFEFTGTLKESTSASQDFLVKASRLLFFMSFLVAISVGFFNLLTGLAVNEVVVSIFES